MRQTNLFIAHESIKFSSNSLFKNDKLCIRKYCILSIRSGINISDRKINYLCFLGTYSCCCWSQSIITHSKSNGHISFRSFFIFHHYIQQNSRIWYAIYKYEYLRRHVFNVNACLAWHVDTLIYKTSNRSPYHMHATRALRNRPNERAEQTEKHTFRYTRSNKQTNIYTHFTYL